MNKRKLWALGICVASTSYFGGDPTMEGFVTPAEAKCSKPLPPALADISHGASSGIRKYRFAGSQTGQMDAIRAKMAEYESLTGIVDFVEDPTATYVISVDPSCGCVALCIPAGCGIGHELGHGLGLAHEQQRIDAGRFILLVHDDDICHDSSEGTRYTDTIWSGTNFGPYNEKSVEHYGPVLGKDSTRDFTRRDGTVDGLGGDFEIITPGDVSSYQQLRARFLGWDRFRSRGTIVGDGPLVPQLVSGVNFQAGQQPAAARLRAIDAALVFGTNGRVYMSTRGTKSSSWREVWTQASHIAATTQGTEIVRARATATGITTQRTTNAATLATSVPAGDNPFIDGLAWASSLNWGLPPSSSVTGFAIGSLGSSQIAVIARVSNGQLWIRRTTSLTSVTGSWTEITSGTASGRPAVAAFGSNLRVFYATASGGVTTLQERLCSSSSCGGATAVRAVQTGTTAAAAASASTLHVMVRSNTGRLEWHRHDTGGAWSPIGGTLVDQPVATNSFEERFGGFAMFAEHNDGNLWQRSYNRYFVGRLANLTPNDYDRDGKTDFVVVRDGTWWILPSTGLPSTPFAFGEPGDVFLPAADFDGNGLSDVNLFRRSNGTWFPRSIDRQQADTGLPITVGPGGALPALQYGMATDRPVPGDYDGDWVMDEAVFRVTTNTWHAALSGGGELTVVFGVATDRQVPADYDGDGKTDVAVYRPSQATWFVHPSGGGADIVQAFCQATDRLVPGDYDGDGRADFGCFRPSTGRWLVRLSTGEADLDISFGVATDRVVPGDYDGDGRMDPAVFRPGVGATAGKWFVKQSSGGPDLVATWGVATDTLPWPEYTQASSANVNDIDHDLRTDHVVVRSDTWFFHQSSGAADILTTLGLATDVPLPASNMAPNGVLELLSFRASNGTWFNRSLDRNGAAGSVALLQYGASTDVPVPGDYDGDSIVDEAVFRPSGGTWHATLSGGGELFLQFGTSTDKAVPADYDGDGRTDPAVFRPSNNTWFVHPSAGGADLVQQWGGAGDRFVPADYDGDRRADFAVFKPSSGRWVALLSANGATQDVTFGVATDRLVPGDYDGDGRTDLAVFRPSEGQWYVHPTGGGLDVVTPFGVFTDKLPWPVHVGN